MNGLSPTSQFSPSGGAGNPTTRGAGMLTWPSLKRVVGQVIVLASRATCRLASWLSRAMAGVASMAVTINPADKSLIVVIEFLLWMQRTKMFGLASWRADRGSGVLPKDGRSTSRSPLKTTSGFSIDF
jgi:hypothetical protein